MNWENEINRITKWLKDYTTKSKTKGYVIGISGGLDSAITASLCVRAVGKENVIGISMPCYSSESSVTDAELLAKNIGIPLLSFNLERAFEAVREPLKRNEPSQDRKISDGNIKARLRMIKVYELANLNNCLVAGTSNKTEMMIGYFTKYGDGGCDIEVIADFYKTELYEMAKFLPEIPISTILKPPSADLWNGQTDEKEIGILYKELDIMLKNVDEMGQIPSTMDAFLCDIATHIDPTAVLFTSPWRKVYQLVRGAEHKNNMPPQYKRTEE